MDLEVKLFKFLSLLVFNDNIYFYVLSLSYALFCLNSQSLLIGWQRISQGKTKKSFCASKIIHGKPGITFIKVVAMEGLLVGGNILLWTTTWKNLMSACSSLLAK